MKSFFKRTPPSPSALPPATPFPSIESQRDGRTSTTLSSSLRSRAFSLSRDHNGTASPTMVISSPMLQTELVGTLDPFHYGRKRLQSGGISFDEVLPSFLSNSSLIPPLPSPSSATVYMPTSPPNALTGLVDVPPSLPVSSTGLSSFSQETCIPAQTMEESPLTPLLKDGEHSIPSPSRTPKSSARHRRGTNEVGRSTPHIDSLVYPVGGSYKEYINYAPRPQLVGRRAASMGDVRGRSDLETATLLSPVVNPILSTAPAMPHSRVRSDQVRDAASARLLAAAEINVRPRATSTSLANKQLAHPRRPALARAAHVQTRHSGSRHTIVAGAGIAQDPVSSSISPLVLSPPMQAASFSTPILALDSPGVNTPPSRPRNSQTSPAITPGLRTPGQYPVGPHSPTSMFSVYPNYERDVLGKIPFPQASGSSQTVLSPFENPQMAAALQVDATRISLDKYDIHQDLTFVLRIQNIVADDVELELVKTVESSETVYELKIKKKDPDNMRVRNGIIPYTYVPPFASPSSSSSPSSMYSSPVTTPTLEVPYGHHNGSYFPMGASRSPRRNSLVNKPAASARSSHLMSRTPTGKAKTSTFNAGKDSGKGPELVLQASSASRAGQISLENQATSPISPSFRSRLGATAPTYDSDEDDDNDNTSVLAHYTPRDAHATQSESVLASTSGGMNQSEDTVYGKSVFNSDDDDNVQERDDETSYRDSTFPFGMKSYWSDTEAEAETEGEEGDEEDLTDSSGTTYGNSSPAGPETP